MKKELLYEISNIRRRFVVGHQQRLKPTIFWADTRKTLRSFPHEVRIDIGHALTQVEQGRTPPDFRHVPGIGKGVMEIRTSHDKETYRAFYVAKFEEAIYVLDVIHKKSKTGIGISSADQDRLRARYKEIRAYREDAGKRVK